MTWHFTAFATILCVESRDPSGATTSMLSVRADLIQSIEARPDEGVVVLVFKDRGEARTMRLAPDDRGLFETTRQLTSAWSQSFSA
jgi:hypothetical protein